MAKHIDPDYNMNVLFINKHIVHFTAHHYSVQSETMSVQGRWLW